MAERNQVVFSIDILSKPKLWTIGALQVHSSSIWVSTAPATFVCKRKPLTVYFLLFLVTF